ncbi:hypothetical protein J6590_047391, partial [Homalodisca vitripennis]
MSELSNQKGVTFDINGPNRINSFLDVRWCTKSVSGLTVPERQCVRIYHLSSEQWLHDGQAQDQEVPRPTST